MSQPWHKAWVHSIIRAEVMDELNGLTTTNNEDEKFELWDQLPEETELAYDLFANFFLPLGLRRSVRQAYILYLREREPQKFIARKTHTPPATWNAMARDYRWQERAEAYDKEVFSDAFQAIEESLVKIRLAAPEAVQALIRELQSPRNAVAAAKELLDRADIRTTGMSRKLTFTAEDLQKAEEELEKWQTKD